MPVNSISPSQTVQTAEAPKNTQVAAVRKQSEIQQSNKVDAQKEESNKMAQMHSKPEPAKPSVNTSGQKTGTIINVAA